ncbi:DUF4190 domain-containing protein [Gordonia sp. IITR100]|uniref:DUF4190 domain-containing protein n=1 Tax=Gordonia sp. IITR100 TaxID=1314686 RepID=UPI0020CA3F18|nr:DUF4190 domain-containing protein [Gordonia sp. IITR100]MCX2756088.1 DUF4190 domain-containing protein [Gordonia sp. 4N]
MGAGGLAVGLSGDPSPDTRVVDGPAAAGTPAVADRPDTETSGPASPATQAYSAVEPAKSSEDSVAPQSGAGPRVSRMALWALALSILGITFIVGLVLGYRARTQIRQRREVGLPFATAAIWVGWAYAGVFVFGLLVYGWILFIA